VEALNILHAFHFLRPWWLLAIPLWVLLSYGVWKMRRQDSGWAKLCDPALLTYLVGDTPAPEKSGFRIAAMMLSGVLAISALAGPVWKQWPQPVFRAQSGMIIVLDLSRSMLAGDIKPSRMVRARQKVRDILNARTGGQTGLIVFAGSAFDVVPLTTDKRAITLLLPSLTPDMMPVQGSNASLALKRAGNMFRRSAIRHGSAVMLCDGVDAGAVTVAQDLARAGDHVSILAVGTPEGAPIPADGGFMTDKHGNIIMAGVNDDRLAAVAAAGNGIFQHIRIDNSDVKQLPGLIPSSLAHGANAQTETGQMQTDQWHEEGPWLLLMVLPLCALAFRRGVLLLLVLVPLLAPYPVHAMSWRDMWHTRDQQAQALMQQHHPAAAAALFSHPQWKAAALYRAGKYTGAAKALDGINQSDALYNRGNALARAGDLGGAIAAYEQALRRDASNADARANRDLIKKLLRQKQKQPRKQRQNKQRKTNEAGKKQQEQERQSANKQGNHRSSSEQHTASPKQNGTSQTQQQNRKQNRDGAMPGAGKKKQQKKQQRTVKSQNMNKHNGTADAQRKTAAQSRRPDEKRIESEKAVKQWLRRIPDDPGGLLRRKFEYQYRNRQQRQAQSGSDQAW